MKKILITLSILFILFSFTSCNSNRIFTDEILKEIIDSDLNDLNIYIDIYKSGNVETRKYIDSLFVVYEENALEIKELLKVNKLNKSEDKLNQYLLLLNKFENNKQKFKP